MQHELSNQPARTAAALARFLDLSAVEEQGMLEVLGSSRVEQTRPVMEHRELGLDETGWDPGLIGVFMTECAEAMEMAGFSLEGRLIGEDSGVRLFFPGRIEGQTETVNVQQNGFFALDFSAFVLVPGAAGSPATVIYRDLPLKGTGAFDAQLQVVSGKPTSVRFRVVVEDEAGQELLNAHTVVRSGDSPVSWKPRLNQVPNSTCRVRISTEFAEVNNATGVQARWLSPRFV